MRRVVLIAAVIWLSTVLPLVAQVDRPARPLTAAEEKGLAAQQRFRECPACPELIVVAAGQFTMGSPGDEPGRSLGEAQMKIAIAQPFAAGKYAVTFDEWDACVADRGCRGYSPSDEGWGRGNRPVINVDLNDATAYVIWLSRKTG